MTYAFIFDASACSGCKACQAACKDKNQLPLGVLWRHVYEVSGGIWEQRGSAWTNTVFAYNMSLACNHCEHPKCAGVCPTNAYVIRSDRIVYIDVSKCMGCGYCAWACPYDAPQYNPIAGHMTKCNFCFDNIDAGLPPACVAACPMRVLDYRDISDDLVPTGYTRLWEFPGSDHPYPLPLASRTEPHLAIKPHRGMKVTEEKNISNYEEIHPHKKSGWEEMPLVIFTLLAQMAVGGLWSILWMFPNIWTLTTGDSILLRMLPLLIVGVALGLGMIASFAHLGTKKNAWRALENFPKSRLSRELLFTGLFGASLLAFSAETFAFHQSTPALLFLAAVLGYLLISSMAGVYRLPARPMWNSWKTNVSFMISTLLMGSLLMAVVLVIESKITGVVPPAISWQIIGFLGLILALAQWGITSKYHSEGMMHFIHLGLSLISILAITFTFLFSGRPVLWSSLITFSAILAEEFIGRWSFYNWSGKN